jgi:hypothetical protein
MPINIDTVAYALALTVGALTVLFIGAVTCVWISIYLINKPGEDDDEPS